MYILKNALLSIRRNKGRNILIGIIILVIAIAASIALAIKNSSEVLINSYVEDNEIIASISMDRESLRGNPSEGEEINSKEVMRERYENIESLTVDDVENYKDSKYVSSYYYTTTVGANSNNLEKVTYESESEFENRGPGRNENTQINSTDFTLIGYSSLNGMTEFIEGNYSIIDGEISTDLESNSCVINSELAENNDLSVGDTITLVNPNDESLTYDLTITGIYEDNNDEANGMNMFSNSANTIITNTTVTEKISSDDDSINLEVTPTFILTSKDVIEKFEEEVKEKGLSEYLKITTNLDQVEESVSSIKNVSTFVTTFLIITLIIGIIVLFVINMINIRERKYEIGVLRTIGMKKSKLALQFILETLIISFVSLLIGCGIGASLSVPTANKLLENEIQSSQNESEEISKNFGKGMMDKANQKGDKFVTESSIEQVSDINAVVDFKVVLELIGIGIVLTFVSSLSSMISIQRFSPLTILRERS